MNDTVFVGAHDHRFGLQRVMPGQQRAALVFGLTVVTMGVEIAAGLAFGSVALLADGLHMGSHAAALGVAWLAYTLVRSHAGDSRFSFGTGKINALGGFASALLLAGLALLMVFECLQRWWSPVAISFDQAIAVAVVGLAVNGLSAWLLTGASEADRQRRDGHRHDHDHLSHHGLRDHRPHDDHNLRAAYLHVLADALTSVLAIAALFGAKYADAVWMDPAMGIVGALIVLRWSFGLCRESSRVLLDRQADAEKVAALKAEIEMTPDDRIVDLHLWCIGPGLWAAELVVASTRPLPPERYKARIPPRLNVVHVAVEVHEVPAHCT